MPANIANFSAAVMDSRIARTAFFKFVIVNYPAASLAVSDFDGDFWRVAASKTI